MIAVRWGAATDVGRVRAINEDSLLARRSVFVVADGMGGHAAGEIASRLAVESFDRMAAAHPVLRANQVVETLHTANDLILAAAHRDAEQRGMGTTVVGLALVNDGEQEYWLGFNIGDSRLYRLHEGRMRQLSVDHSEVQELVDAGVISPADTRHHPRRNVLTRALGTEPAPAIDCWPFTPVPGERFLLCSDGLYGELTDQEIAGFLAVRDDAQSVAARLATAAVGAGGRDNVTVIVIDVLGSEHSWADEPTDPNIRFVVPVR